MQVNYKLHDITYKKLKEKGEHGWGGLDRLNKGEEFIERIFSCPETPSKGKALELGCGEGNISRLLFKKGFEVTGIDVSETAIEWAKEKSSEITYIKKDLTELNVIQNMKFDLIVDGNCLHCILGKDRNIFLFNVYNALNKNGVFFVSSLCSKDENNHISFFNNNLFRHISSKNNLLKELENSNFKVIKCSVHKRVEFDHINIHAVKND